MGEGGRRISTKAMTESAASGRCALSRSGLDGGGIRGFFAARLLERLMDRGRDPHRSFRHGFPADRRHEHRTLIGSALAAGIPLTRIAAMFRAAAGRRSFRGLPRSAGHLAWSSGTGVASADAHAFRAVLDRFSARSRWASSSLAGASRCACRRRTCARRSGPPLRDAASAAPPPRPDSPLVDACMASCAAPMLLPPFVFDVAGTRARTGATEACGRRVRCWWRCRGACDRASRNARSRSCPWVRRDAGARGRHSRVRRDGASDSGYAACAPFRRPAMRRPTGPWILRDGLCLNFAAASGSCGCASPTSRRGRGGGAARQCFAARVCGHGAPRARRGGTERPRCRRPGVGSCLRGGDAPGSLRSEAARRTLIRTQQPVRPIAAAFPRGARQCTDFARFGCGLGVKRQKVVSSSDDAGACETSSSPRRRGPSAVEFASEPAAEYAAGFPPPTTPLEGRLFAGTTNVQNSCFVETTS